MSTGREPGWVMWGGTIGSHNTPFDERVLAAAGAGCARLSVNTRGIKRDAELGTSPQDHRRFATANGIELIVDPILTWLPCDEPADSPLALGASFGFDAVIAMSEALGARSMTAVAPTICTLSVAAMAERFGILCDRVAAFGCQVHLEFIPMTVVPDLATAWEIVRLADRANGGLVFDTWHFFRGAPDFDLLARIPGDRIFAVQLNDAPAALQGTLWDDTWLRLLPGDGAFDLGRTVEILAKIDALTWVGPEILSTAPNPLPPPAMAKLAMARVRRLLAEAQ